jgi:hypothetical protein
MLAKVYGWQEYPTANLSNLLSTAKRAKGRRTMRVDLSYLPHGNPCAQCGKPIAAPDWIETGPGPREISYLWYCRACDYRFEAVAIFAEAVSESPALAA